ncbi:glutaredoxin family protein [Methylococcus geothermalis]|uniref:Glutaredoxin family protein n=1 Tax=Methylococcus geothermalis TaxID=2681310 RepID=A0A858Q7S5_9GAMM|nr:glutaredoxin family protein [Methylococcus geothermalis]QJD29853.1 glutaredoxin family protein [Methylococcus geothermalis]
MPTESGLLLYGTDGCHLCEEAESVLASLGVAAKVVDIAGDDDLLQRYGVRIPVLRDGAGRELGWPFDAEAARRFLEHE